MSFRILPVAFGALLLWGCAAAEPTRVQGRERDGFVPRLRIAHEAPPGEPLLRPPEPRIVPFTGAELDVAFARGEAGQDLGAGQAVDFSGTVFAGPGRVEIEYERWLVSASGRLGVRIEDAFRLEGLFGLGMQYVSLSLESPTLHDRDSTTSSGFHFGARAAVDPLPWASAYLQVTGFDGWGSGRGVDTPAYEVGAVLRPIREVGLLAGWRRWDYIEERSDSDVRLNAQGFFLGLELGF
jgi:hypothetical protein